MGHAPWRGRAPGALAIVAMGALLVACAAGPEQSASTSASASRSVASTPVSASGFAISVPGTWTTASRGVIGTAFQQQAQVCRSAEVVDGPAPSGSGSSELQRGAIQICTAPRADTLTLQQWLTRRGVPSTTPARYGSCEVLVAPGTDARRLAYAQSADLRAEIATTNTSPPASTSQRGRDIRAALATMRCPPS
jgi:hypothetical protein